MGKLVYEQESYVIRGGCFEVYRQFRNRHKESVYNKALVNFLEKRGLKIEREKHISIFFEGKKVGVYIPDIVVEDKILLEIKCKPFVTKEDTAQLWYYLKVTDFKLGFLINFGNKNGVEIIRRVYGR